MLTISCEIEFNIPYYHSKLRQLDSLDVTTNARLMPIFAPLTGKFILDGVIRVETEIYAGRRIRLIVSI